VPLDVCPVQELVERERPGLRNQIPLLTSPAQCLREPVNVGMPIDQEKSGLQTTQILTKDNVGDITTWSEPKDALDQFKALWQLG